MNMLLIACVNHLVDYTIKQNHDINIAKILLLSGRDARLLFVKNCSACGKYQEWELKWNVEDGPAEAFERLNVNFCPCGDKPKPENNLYEYFQD